MKIGEKCTVVMSRNGIFESQDYFRFEAILTHVPQDVGDCFYFKVDNKIMAINPSSVDFVGIEQETK